MVRVKVTDIEWDREVDGEVQDVNLPSRLSLLELRIDREDFDSPEDFDDAVGDEICNYLSDLEGFCVSSVTWDYV